MLFANIQTVQVIRRICIGWSKTWKRIVCLVEIAELPNCGDGLRTK